MRYTKAMLEIAIPSRRRPAPVSSRLSSSELGISPQKFQSCVSWLATPTGWLNGVTGLEGKVCECAQNLRACKDICRSRLSQGFLCLGYIEQTTNSIVIGLDR